jgi:hypothetical protein
VSQGIDGAQPSGRAVPTMKMRLTTFLEEFRSSCSSAEVLASVDSHSDSHSLQEPPAFESQPRLADSAAHGSNVECQGNLAVTERLHHDTRVDCPRQQQRRCRVAEIVNPNGNDRTGCIGSCRRSSASSACRTTRLVRSRPNISTNLLDRCQGLRDTASWMPRKIEL